MSKDPAVLFYTSDFLTGTALMSYEQKGIYITLLCFQHQHGGQIDKVSFNTFVGVHAIVRRKFIETEDGFFNERMMLEMSKRGKTSTSMSLNAKKRWEEHNANAMQKHCNGIATAMPTEDEDENERVVKERIVKERKKFVPPTLEEVRAWAAANKVFLNCEEFFNHFTANGWVSGRTPLKDWHAAARNWYLRQKKWDKTPAPEAMPDKFAKIKKSLEEERNAAQL